MTKRFGKYKSRRTKRKRKGGGLKEDVVDGLKFAREAAPEVVGMAKDIHGMFKDLKKKDKKGGFIEDVKEAAPHVLEGIKEARRAIPDVVDAYHDIRGAYHDIRDLFGKEEEEEKGGALDFHPHLGKIAHGISDYAHKHIKAAAHHILRTSKTAARRYQDPHNIVVDAGRLAHMHKEGWNKNIGDAHDYVDKVGRASKQELHNYKRLIMHHSHNVTANEKHIYSIMNSSKGQLRKHMQNPDMHRAMSDVMHVAEKGGSIDFRHELGHANRGGALDGESIDKFMQTAEDLQSPVHEAHSAEHSYDKVNFDNRSVKGLGRNAAYGLSGNFHVASSHMKAGMALIPGLAAFMEPGAQTFSGVGYGLSAIGDRI